MKKIINKNGNLLFWADGKEILPAAYMTYNPKAGDFAGFRDIGYRLFEYCVYLSDLPVNVENGLRASFEPGCRGAEDCFDYSPLDNGMKLVLGDREQAADIYVLLRINLNMPSRWQEKYPEEMIRYHNGERPLQSVASLQWRKDACLFLQKLKEHIDISPYRKNVIGWQVAGMQTEEWIHPPGYRLQVKEDLPMQQAFRAWCRTRYQTLDALNREWESSYADFASIPLPSVEQLHEKNASGPSSPSARMARDFYICLSEAYADTISYFTRYVKELYDGDIFCGAFTGYIGQLTDDKGHCTMNRLLDEESIDFFASPFAYTNARGPGVDWIYHAPMQSVTDAGKLWFLEADVRTCLTKHLSESRPDLCDKDLAYFALPVFFGPDSTEQSKANILRSFSKCLISGHAFWWFDMWGGWYQNEEFMRLHKRLYEIYIEKTETAVKNSTELAVVLDERASGGCSDAMFVQSVHRQLIELGYLGAPYDLLLLDRVRPEDVEKYKMFICLSPDQSAAAYDSLKQRLASSGKRLLVTGNGNTGEQPFYDKNTLLKEAEAAGVFIYSFGNIVYANDKYIAVTATEAGEISLSLPFDGVLEDLIDRSLIATQNHRLTWQTASNLCRLFRWQENKNEKE